MLQLMKFKIIIDFQAAVFFLLVAITCFVQGSPVPESAPKEKRALVYSTGKFINIFSQYVFHFHTYVGIFYIILIFFSRGLLAYHAPIYSHAPVVASPYYAHAAPVVAHAPVAHAATSYSSFTINHPIVAHAPVVAAHAPVYTAHAPFYASYYH